jgi:hypothetical protein
VNPIKPGELIKWYEMYADYAGMIRDTGIGIYLETITRDTIYYDEPVVVAKVYRNKFNDIIELLEKDVERLLEI